jgi:hypothetical protein
VGQKGRARHIRTDARSTRCLGCLWTLQGVELLKSIRVQQLDNGAVEVSVVFDEKVEAPSIRFEERYEFVITGAAP